MRAPVIILGSESVRLGEEALLEPKNATIDDLEKLLARRPRAAVITSGGESGFFRASLCLERCISRVVIRRGLFDEAWERELASRAMTFGAELHVHDDTFGYGRVKLGARASVGVPDAAAWAANASGLVVDEEWIRRAHKTEPLAMDADIAGLPSNLEEIAFANCDKPVLYLVVPASELERLQMQYQGKTMVCREIPLAIESSTGRRVYESPAGERKTHVFISRDAELAQRAAQLWDEGSSRNAVAIGELLGYPSCCVAAFVALEERGNNAALTYITAARSRALGAPFQSLLNSAVRHVIPCTPCSFGCTRAIELAQRVVGALPAHVAEPLRRALERPVLYFDEAHAVVFEGARMDGHAIEYAEARFLPASAPLGPDDEMATRRLLGALLAGPGKLFVTDDAFEVHVGNDVRRMARARPKLGIVLAFGRS